ncbi:MAG TPA: preprotein translocase subunit SecE [Candidatus Olsenella stercoravium]|uniref:Protein translocase subunit SecE n=1 Tax=Candidatus Olsenella stercoravium TaxID=2838713 RepID=A0A9D2DIX8_9ACTN|nr:preprotein translocase subunit SecE [Candidatus Olsenella stercoravium]
MANKDRNKRSVRKARAEERARIEAARTASAPAAGSSSKPSQAPAKAEKKTEKKPAKKSDKKPGIFRRFFNYLGDVRSEMKRVVWPSKGELKSYSVAIIAMLIVFGVIIWLVDSGIVAALVGYTGLRG